MKGDIDEIKYIIELLNNKKENNNNIECIFTDKVEYQNELNKLKNILKEYYTNNNCDIKIKNLIKLIIIEGWNELTTSIEDKIYWFKDFYEFNKNTDIREIINKNDLNLEYYFLLFYEKYPFYCLIKKLDFTRNSLTINNNYNKINIVKAFNLYPIIYKKNID